MISSLIVVHKKGDLPLFSASWLEWKTCLRHILIGHKDYLKIDSHLHTDVEVYHSHEAIRFLMEVASGLYSPMLGETEVFGQYRKFLSEIEAGSCNWGTWLSHTLEQIRISVKRVRSNHLIGLGSFSYGSLIRRKVKDYECVNFIGSGQLVEEIAPWLAKKKSGVNVFCRNPEAAQIKFIDMNFLNIYHLSELNDQVMGAVVICAPIEARQIESQLATTQVEKIIDLRGESRLDPLKIEKDIELLGELFSEIEKNKTIAKGKVQLARKSIEEIIQNNLNP